MAAINSEYTSNVKHLSEQVSVSTDMFSSLEVLNIMQLSTLHCIKETGKQKHKSINIMNLYDIFGCYSLDDPNVVKKNVIQDIDKNIGWYSNAGHICLTMKSLNIITWLTKMKKPRTPADELMLYALSILYRRHTIVYTKWQPWTTLKLELNNTLSTSEMHELCDTHLLFLGNNLYGELKRLSQTDTEPLPMKLSDLHQSRFIDYEINTHEINLTIIGTRSQTNEDMQSSSSSDDLNNDTQDTKPETVGNPFHILSDAYADFLSRGPIENMLDTTKHENDEEKLSAMDLQDLTSMLTIPPTVIDPNCSIHGLSIDQKNTVQEATVIVATQQVPTLILPEANNDHALQEATSTSEPVSTSSLPDATEIYTLSEATGSDRNVLHACSNNSIRTIITLPEATADVTTVCNNDSEAALDYSTSLETIQEYNNGELIVIAPITTTTESIQPKLTETSSTTKNSSSSNMYSDDTMELADKLHCTDHGIVAPDSEKSGDKTGDLASVSSQSSDTPIVPESSESDTPHYKKIYYSCLIPQEDNIIYIHYRDIISRPCKVNLLKMTRQEIEMFTSIKDSDMNLAHPKCKRSKPNYSGFESNEDNEPRAKKQVVTRPGREPSAQCIAARKLVMSSRRKNKTPMQILKNIDCGAIPVNEQPSSVNPPPKNTITQNDSPEQGDVGPCRESDSTLVTPSSLMHNILQIDISKVNDNSNQDNKNVESDSDATIEYTPPPPNPDPADEVTPKGCFHNKLCWIKKGKKKQLYYCQLCTVRTYSVHELNNHYKDQHDSFHCLVCVKVFDNPHSRNKHVYMHRQNQHLCLDCDKTFPFASQLQNHCG